MDYKEVFRKLYTNEKSILQETIRILCVLADNIIENPSNEKYRTLKKSNRTIASKILQVKGGEEALKAMGFVEQESAYLLLNASSLNLVKDFRSELTLFQNNPNYMKESVLLDIPSGSNPNNRALSRPIIKRVVLPPLDHMFENPFLRHVETHFHNVLAYEDESLRARARDAVPYWLLVFRALDNMRTIQKHVKNGAEDPAISFQDCLLLELLSWFKEDFFTWVDSPPCENCGKDTQFSHMSTDISMFLYTDRIEMHKCLTCRMLTTFPRYNDLNILLETRRGRCGEWANTFTLLCRALGWDARFVVEEGDHVWTEVFSVTQDRWIHCDPCENACDTPLIYEHGWGKKLSYIMAYSCDEVQDVTWRYSSNHKEVLKRRNSCSEQELVQAMAKLRENRQKDFSTSKKKYLTKRVLKEIVELMVERQPNEKEDQGRTSGSLDWRLARKEYGSASKNTSFEWVIDGKNFRNNEVTLRYSSSSDTYTLSNGEGVISSVTGWENGVYEQSNIFRKEEHDWKQVYLARKDGCNEGKISWKLKVDDDSISIEEIQLYFSYATFQNGKVQLSTSPSDAKSLYTSGVVHTIKLPSQCKAVTITATLTGGQGDVAWQHAQLFREPMDFDGDSLIIKVKQQKS